MPIDTTRFVAASGRQFVYRKEYSNSSLGDQNRLPTEHGNLIYSPDGQTYLETINHGFVGDEYYHTLRFEETTTDTSGTVRRFSGVLYFEDEAFAESHEPFDPSKVTYVGLPNGREPYWLGRMEDGTFVYLSVQAYTSWNYPRLYSGGGIYMRYHEIEEIDFLIGDGEWYARSLDKEVLSIPLGLPGFDVVPMWLERFKLTELDPNDFDITETPDHVVTIREKSPAPAG